MPEIRHEGLTMNDRELVISAMEDSLSWVEGKGHVPMCDVEEAADAVLTALAGRIIPELPEWVEEATVVMVGDLVGEGTAVEYSKIAHGNGATLFDAITNALESAT
jgi:hypothetical protein